MRKALIFYILDESNRAEVYHHCEGSKEELVRDVSRFYSSSHDRFTYGSSFINFNLPQFYQIVKNRWPCAGDPIPYAAYQHRAASKPGS
ncbi:Adenylate cyclase [Salmonella enterica subsp. enterica]|uniref:Adenylate cyclase n=1 Tax=Salmonella enterica I TaxID=59201 RepID=A0A379UXS4_SALET|nr:Adenylate cyclase [Salmonella enterica subsp. enterica]